MSCCVRASERTLPRVLLCPPGSGWQRALVLLALVWQLCAAPAGAFQVSPVRVDLNPRQSATQMVVSNPGTQTLLVQAEAFDWTQQHDQDQLRPSQSLIVNPPIFELAPGAQQVLRVGLRRGAEPGVERAYRLWLSQVPTPAAGADTGVQMLLRLSLPVFVVGADTGAPQPRWRSEGHATEAVIALDNAGSRHLHVRELRLRTEGTVALALGPCYALPAGQCRWAVPETLRGRTLHLEADTDAGPMQTRIDASPVR